MSTQYGVVLSLVYLFLAGFLVYRGYQRHDQTSYIFAGIVVLAAVIRLMRVQRAAKAQTLQPPQAGQPENKVDLFTKPKDF